MLKPIAKLLLSTACILIAGACWSLGESETQFIALLNHCKENMNDVTKIKSYLDDSWTLDKFDPDSRGFRASYDKKFSDGEINVQYQNFSSANICRVILYTPTEMNLESTIYSSVFANRTKDFESCEDEAATPVKKEGELLPSLYVQYYTDHDKSKNRYIVAIEMQKSKSSFFKYNSICD